MPVVQPYAPRPVTALPTFAHGDWLLHHYTVRFGEEPLDAPHFETGRALALRALPDVAVAPGRAGLGFLIDHQGNGMDYIVLGWWDRENELPLRVFVHDRGAASQWRAARGAESICVWDLEVIWAERQAYVEDVMGQTVERARDTFRRRDSQILR